MNPEVVRYSERPGLWDSIGDLSSEVVLAEGHTIPVAWDGADAA